MDGGINVELGDSWTAGFSCLGALVLQEAAVDPCSHEIGILLGKLVTPGGHEGLGGMGYGGVELGAAAVTGRGNSTSRPACHHAGEVGQVKISLLLVRIVAVQAGRLEDRVDVIVIGDLFCRLQRHE